MEKETTGEKRKRDNDEDEEIEKLEPPQKKQKLDDKVEKKEKEEDEKNEEEKKEEKKKKNKFKRPKIVIQPVTFDNYSQPELQTPVEQILQPEYLFKMPDRDPTPVAPRKNKRDSIRMNESGRIVFGLQSQDGFSIPKANPLSQSLSQSSVAESIDFEKTSLD